MDSVGDALIVNGIHRRPKCYARVIRMSRNCLFFHQVLWAAGKCHHPQDGDDDDDGHG